MFLSAKKTYQQANYLTANPMKLVLMCYEGAISNIKLASRAYADKDYAAKGKALQKALDIIYELNASLDMEKGGDIAKNLRTLYSYMSRILTEADMKRDVKMFDHVVNMLEELESAWKTMAKPVLVESNKEGANQVSEAKSIKNHHIGAAPYGSVLSTTTVARAWSV